MKEFINKLLSRRFCAIRAKVSDNEQDRGTLNSCCLLLLDNALEMIHFIYHRPTESSRCGQKTKAEYVGLYLNFEPVLSIGSALVKNVISRETR